MSGQAHTLDRHVAPPIQMCSNVQYAPGNALMSTSGLTHSTPRGMRPLMQTQRELLHEDSPMHVAVGSVEPQACPRMDGLMGVTHPVDAHTSPAGHRHTPNEHNPVMQSSATRHLVAGDPGVVSIGDGKECIRSRHLPNSSCVPAGQAQYPLVHSAPLCASHSSVHTSPGSGLFVVTTSTFSTLTSDDFRMHRPPAAYVPFVHRHTPKRHRAPPVQIGDTRHDSPGDGFLITHSSAVM